MCQVQFPLARWVADLALCAQVEMHTHALDAQPSLLYFTHCVCGETAY